MEVVCASTLVKKDDAKVPIHLWNKPITPLLPLFTDTMLTAMEQTYHPFVPFVHGHGVECIKKIGFEVGLT